MGMSIWKILKWLRYRRSKMLVLQRYPLASEMRPAIERGWTGELAAKFLRRG